MEETKLQRNGGSLVILLINIWLLNLVESAEYTVGDDEEWNTGVNFLSWSEKYNFTVGDVLGQLSFFNFSPFLINCRLRYPGYLKFKWSNGDLFSSNDWHQRSG